MTEELKDVRGERYYFLQYTTHDGLVVVHMTDREDSWLREKARHEEHPRGWKFWTADRFGMTLNCR